METVMTHQDLDVQAFINRHPFSPYQWRFWR
jgi:AAHS family 4-hydroxybenzoate transporter-like MFS transporter